MRIAIGLLCIALSMGNATAQTERLPRQLIPLLVQLDGESIGDGIQAYSDGQSTWLPLRQIALLLEIPIAVDVRRRKVNGWLFDRTRRWVLDVDTSQAQAFDESQSEPIQPQAAITPRLPVRSEVHVRPEVLEQLWPVEVEVSRSDLQVRIEGVTRLPRQRRIARERERAGLNRTTGRRGRRSLARTGTGYAWWQPPSGIARFGVGQTRGGLLRTTARITAVGELAGATAFATGSASRSSNRDAGIDTARLTLRRFASPDPMPLNVREIGLGDLNLRSAPDTTAGARGVGVSVSSYPLRNTETFEPYTLADDAEPGSEVELYRRDELIDFAEVDETGRYRFDNIPIQAGINPLRVVIRQPNGERIVQRYQPVYGRNQIPSGEFRYQVAAVKPGARLITEDDDGRGADRPVGTLRVGWGVRRRTTAGMRLIRAQGEDPSTRADYARIALTQGIGPTETRATAQRALDGGMLYGAAIRYPRRQWPVTAEVRINNGLESEEIGFGDNALRRAAEIRTTGDIAIGGYPMRLRLNASRSLREQETASDSLQIRQAGRLGDIRWRNRLDWDSRDGVIDGSLAFSDWMAMGEARQLRWSGQMDYRQAAGIQTLSLSGRLPLPRTGIDLDATWTASRNPDIHRLNLSMADDLASGRATLSGNLTTDGDYGIQASWQIYFADRRGKPPLFTEINPTGQGRMRLRVFLDRDRNGVRDPADPPLPGVRLKQPLANQGETGENGELMIAGLRPHRYYRAQLDPMSLNNPLHRVQSDGQRVWVRPGSTPVLDIPVEPTGAIYGHARFAGEREGAEGIPLRLVNCAGETVARKRTRFNGFFAFEGLDFQRHWLRVDNESGFRMLDKPDAALDLSAEQPYASEERIAVAARSTLNDFGAVQGTLVAPDCNDGLGNVRLQIQPVDTDHPPYRLITSADGHFQLDRLPFGRYRIAVVEKTLAAGIRLQGSPPTVEVSDDDPFVSDLHIHTKERP
ncbi:collagen binding domain-containing protein [Spiribacter pallidus]|uniref:hypothetical protein n=1 Tax=Spiribacter pallidus TaxID=1987936 RepID=UPI0034A01D7A